MVINSLQMPLLTELFFSYLSTERPLQKSSLSVHLIIRTLTLQNVLKHALELQECKEADLTFNSY